MNNSLHIALVGPLPPPSGGMATQTAQLKRLLESQGVDVELVQVNRPYSPKWIGQIRGLRAVFRLIPYLFTLWRTFKRIDLVHLMANSGWSWHLFATPVVWIAALRKKPVVVNYRGGEAASFLDRQLRWVRPTLFKATLVVVPSKFLYEVFGTRGIETKIVPNIIDLARFSAVPKKNIWDLKRRLSFAVTRNLEPIYDVATAIEAFALVRQKNQNATLTVAGEGEDLEDLKKLAARLHIDGAVTFTGRLSHVEMAELYGNTDILLNTSLADNMPNSLLEAMASEVVVVSSNVGGIPYLVENRNTAMLVEPGSPEAIAEAVDEVVANDELRKRLVNSAREQVASYTWDKVRQQWLDVYSDMLTAKPMQVNR